MFSDAQFNHFGPELEVNIGVNNYMSLLGEYIGPRQALSFINLFLPFTYKSSILMELCRIAKNQDSGHKQDLALTKLFGC